MTRLILTAPISGYLIPIDQVPDPVFAGKLVGDGVAIDPLDSKLLAPCDGTVRQVHPSGHAVTVSGPGEVEVLMHVGLDTVQLRGEGFRPRVKVGDAVKQGDVLIEFDPEVLARKARSLLTEIVIATPDRVGSMIARTGRVTAGKDPVLEIEIAAAQATTPQGGPESVSEPIVLPNPAGMHARPAATLASLAKRFKSRVFLRKGAAEANARSLVDVLSLSLAKGDTVQVVARGEDAQAAIAAIVPQVKAGLGDDLQAAPHAAPAAGERLVAPARPDPHAAMRPGVPAPTGDPKKLRGTPASQGLAVGRVFHLTAREVDVSPVPAGPPPQERRTLDTALAAAQGQLSALTTSLSAGGDAERGAIFGAHAELLEDPTLLELSYREIERGKSAAYAWREAFTAQAGRLAALDNPILAGRATDLRDVGARVLAILTGDTGARQEIPVGSILVAEDLTPSDTAQLDRTRVLGFATTRGGATSHVAIIARSLSIPALAGVDARVLDVKAGTRAILDGVQGLLRLDPNDAEVAAVEKTQVELAERRVRDTAAANEPAVTTDGHRIEVCANAGDLKDVQEGIAQGGEGVGLLRSEFLFMERDRAPTEDEQAEEYAKMAQALGPERTLVIRTLDVGGDKPLSYLPVPHEENPFLGQRGLRLMFEKPEMLRAQLRAILRASKHGKVVAMLPMISDIAEFRAARAIWDEEALALGIQPAPLGIMIEVPSAALAAEVFAKEAAFFSVGSNDLTQYVLAMDRGHPKLAPQVDGLHPAVLQLIGRAADAAHRHGKWIGVCGGIASDEAAVPLLIGLGVTELSVSVPAIPAIKARVRSLSKEKCVELAKKALEAESAAAVRALLEGGAR